MNIKQVVKFIAAILCFLIIDTIPVQASLLFGQGHNGRATDLWAELRSSFKLPDAVNQPEVQRQIHWLIKHPRYLQKLAAQSEPYIYHIVRTIKERNLPGELALLPMIESSYDPFAYSGSGALGLWQIMPGTGSHLGVKRSSGYDGRRDIIVSTDAALNYLNYLHGFFHGNWTLALAAYDSGEGTVKKAVKHNQRLKKPIDFWSLKLPQETQTYVPRLLAIATIIRHPNYYPIKLPAMAYQPYFDKVEVTKQMDFKQAAQLAEVSVQDIKQLNPGYSQKTLTPAGPKKLLLPIESVETFKANYQQHEPSHSTKAETQVATSNQQHKIRQGETLGAIAKRYHVSVQAIQAANHIKNAQIRAGKMIVIPGVGKSEEVATPIQVAKAESKTQYYTVKRGDSLDKIARKHHMSVKALRKINRLSRYLKPGQKLKVVV